AEALDMLQAMYTGHDGSLTTVHSNGPRHTLSRSETMVLRAGSDLPGRAIREQVASAINLIVHVSRPKAGTRRITHITEVEGMEGEIITLQDLFLFDFGMGVDEDGKYLGRLKATGIRPTFSEDLENQGIRLPADLFDPEPFARRRDDSPSHSPPACWARCRHSPRARSRRSRSSTSSAPDTATAARAC